MYTVNKSLTLHNKFNYRVQFRLLLRAALAGVTSLLVFCAFGCAAQSQYTGTEYRDQQVAFRIGEAPPGYRRLQSRDAKLLLQNDQLGSTLMLNARCEQDGDDVPLRSLVQHLFIQFTEREQISEREFILDGRAAYEMVLQARLDGVERHFIVIVLKKNGCVFDFVQVDGAVGDLSQEVKAQRESFRQMVYGFSMLEGKP